MKRHRIWIVFSTAACVISTIQVIIGEDGMPMLTIGLIMFVLATVESNKL